MRKFLFLVLASQLAGCGSTKLTPTPPPEQSYFTEGLGQALKPKIPDFPAKNTAAQKADEVELQKLQKNRTAKDCERAATEVIITPQSFYGKPYGPLEPRQVAIVTPLLDKVRKDNGDSIGQIKEGYNRQRPYNYIVGLKPCIRQETSFAYPSGHATLASEFASVLIDVLPSQAEAIRQRRDEIGRDRLLGGVHHPTDVQAGFKLGELLHDELVKSKEYQNDIEKYKKRLAN